MNLVRSLGKTLLIALPLVLVASCAVQQTRNATSVVNYLYPDTKDPVVQPSVPVLTLPIRVGIAFVPGERGQRSGASLYGATQTGGISEQERLAVMNEVADHFKQYDFVEDIQIIPSAYLTPQGGFQNLDQIRTMYGIDVIALLSYDQAQFTDDGAWSLTYWTIVGAYVVEGTKNSTHTMVDAAVFDIPSRKMLFRAPGVSRIDGRSTPVDLSLELRQDREKGFEEASRDMIANLDRELTTFKARVKERPEEYKVVHSAGYTGGGAVDGLTAAIALLIGGLAL